MNKQGKTIILDLAATATAICFLPAAAAVVYISLTSILRGRNQTHPQAHRAGPGNQADRGRLLLGH